MGAQQWQSLGWPGRSEVGVCLISGSTHCMIKSDYPEMRTKLIRASREEKKLALKVTWL
jgi:hypothetical protein